MGALSSRQNAGVEEVDIGSTHAYRYPPKTGNYFSSHFIMGGERFETPQPEAYLFGENSDLNFLGSRPTPFPYPAPQANEPTKTLKSLVNIRKESLRFVRTLEVQISDGEPTSSLGTGQGHGDEEDKSSRFNIEFIFDSDCHCAITVYYFCTEEVSSSGVTYIPRDPTMNSETYHYKRGVNQQFSQSSHTFDPSQYSEDEVNYNPDKEVIPIAIQCVAEEGEEPHQSHTTIAVVEKHSDGTYVLKALKQKLFVDGLCYLLQEIYGIENKNSDTAKTANDEDTEDSGSECVICMCDVRDTLILPCRHLCLCNSCADSLRYQANNCPICRAPFRALLQVRALQKIQSLPLGIPPPEGVPDNIPVGYEAISLIEALNGPFQPQPLPPTHTITIPSAPLDASTPTNCDGPARAAEVLNSIGPFPPRTVSPSSEEATQGHNPAGAMGCTTPEICMSVMVSNEEDEKEESGEEGVTLPPLSGGAALPPLSGRKRGRDKSVFIMRDTVTMISETSHRDREDGEEAEEHSLLDAATSTSEQPACSPEHRSVSVSVSPEALCDDQGDDSGTREEATMSPVLEESGGGSGNEEPLNSTAAPLNRCKPRSTQMSGKATLTAEGGSLPGTPQSAASQGSQRSSGDSFSSTSSTRQLLPHPSQETLSEDKAVP